jgi:hypothetical protein
VGRLLCSVWCSDCVGTIPRQNPRLFSSAQSLIRQSGQGGSLEENASNNFKHIQQENIRSKPEGVDPDDMKWGYGFLVVLVLCNLGTIYNEWSYLQNLHGSDDADNISQADEDKECDPASVAEGGLEGSQELQSYGNSRKKSITSW